MECGRELVDDFSEFKSWFCHRNLTLLKNPQTFAKSLTIFTSGTYPKSTGENGSLSKASIHRHRDDWVFGAANPSESMNI